MVFEPGQSVVPGQTNRAGGAVPLLSQNQLGQAALLGVVVEPIGRGLVVVLLAVQHHHHVRILFDGSRFPQIAHAGTVAFPLFGRPVQLGQSQHRDLQFTGHGFDPPGDLRDFNLSRFHSGAHAHELQVVDHDAPQA